MWFSQRVREANIETLKGAATKVFQHPHLLSNQVASLQNRASFQPSSDRVGHELKAPH